MSGTVVNLRTFKKRKERAERAVQASENRATHGRTKAERRFDEARADAADRSHDGRRLGSDEDPPKPG